MFGVEGLVVGVGVKLVGKLIDRSAPHLPKLVARYWAAVLFEFYENVCELRAATASGDMPMRFAVHDALLPELCRLDPSPVALAKLDRAVGRLRHVHEMYLAELRGAAIPRTWDARHTGHTSNWRARTDGVVAEVRAAYAAIRQQHLIAARGAYSDDEEWQKVQFDLTPPELA